MHLPLAPFLAFLSQRAFSHPLSHRQPKLEGDITVDPGYWNLTLARGNAASGYRWENLDAVYSGAPDTVIRCKELYDPNTQNTTSSCDEPSFQYAVGPLRVEGTCKLMRTSLIKGTQISCAVQSCPCGLSCSRGVLFVGAMAGCWGAKPPNALPVLTSLIFLRL